MTEVGVQRFASGDDQEHRAEHAETAQVVADQKLEAVRRIYGLENFWRVGKVEQAKGRQREKPQQRDWPEDEAKRRRATTLNRE
jgi:hypothetical protein